MLGSLGHERVEGRALLDKFALRLVNVLRVIAQDDMALRLSQIVGMRLDQLLRLILFQGRC